MQLCAYYGREKGYKSPCDLLKATSKMNVGGPDSLKEVMELAGAECLRPEELEALNPTQWRKPGFIRPGHQGHQGPYAAPAPRQATPKWWGPAARSSPQQDRQRRQDEQEAARRHNQASGP